MLARQNERGKYIKDVEETKKIQGSQFTKIIKGIVEAKWYGYTLLEIMPDINPLTGKLAEVNIIERRNVLASQLRVVQRQGQWNLDGILLHRNTPRIIYLLIMVTWGYSLQLPQLSLQKIHSC